MRSYLNCKSTDRVSGSQGTGSTVSTQSTPHPRAKITPAGKSPCEVARELRDQALKRKPLLAMKLRLAADESYLAASLKTCALQEEDKLGAKSPPSAHCTGAGGGHDAEAETKACSRVRFRLLF